MRTALFSNQFRLADHSRNTWCTGTEYTFCSRGTGQQLLSRKWDFHKLQIVRLHGKSVSNAIPESPTTRKYVCTTAERMTMTTTTTAIMSLAASLWFHHPWSCCPSETNGTMLCSSETSPLQPLFGVRHQTTRSPPSIQKAVFNGDPSGLPMLQRRPKKQSTRRMATSTSQQHTMPTYIHTVRDDDSTCAQVRTDRDVVWCAYDTGRWDLYSASRKTRISRAQTFQPYTSTGSTGTSSGRGRFAHRGMMNFCVDREKRSQPRSPNLYFLPHEHFSEILWFSLNSPIQRGIYSLKMATDWMLLKKSQPHEGNCFNYYVIRHGPPRWCDHQCFCRYYQTRFLAKKLQISLLMRYSPNRWSSFTVTTELYSRSRSAVISNMIHLHRAFCRWFFIFSCSSWSSRSPHFPVTLRTRW